MARQGSLSKPIQGGGGGGGGMPQVSNAVRGQTQPVSGLGARGQQVHGFQGHDKARPDLTRPTQPVPGHGTRGQQVHGLQGHDKPGHGRDNQFPQRPGHGQDRARHLANPGRMDNSGGGGHGRPEKPDPHKDPIFNPPQNPTFEPSNPQPSARSEQVAPVPERKTGDPVGPPRLGPDTLKGLVQGKEVTYQRVGADGRPSLIDPMVNIPTAPVAQPAIVPGTGSVCRDQYGQLVFYEGGVKIGPLAQESNAELRDVDFPTCAGATSAVPAGGYLPAEPAVNYFCPSPGALCYPARGTVF